MRALAGAVLWVGALAFGPDLVNSTGWGFLIGCSIGAGLVLMAASLFDD